MSVNSSPSTKINTTYLFTIYFFQKYPNTSIMVKYTQIVSHYIFGLSESARHPYRGIYSSNDPYFIPQTDGPCTENFCYWRQPKPPYLTYFIAFLGHFEVKILKNMWNFVKNSQSTNILPQIWLKVQILLPPPPPSWHFWRIYTPEFIVCGGGSDGWYWVITLLP